MRRYDDPVEVRKGMIGDARTGVEGPAQFLWHGRLWVVREVVAHWVETGPWWSSAEARAVIGSEENSQNGQQGPTDLLPEREVWRVEAGPGMSGLGMSGLGMSGPGRAGRDGVAGIRSGQARGTGIFDLSFDWAEGCWQLVGCLD